MCRSSTPPPCTWYNPNNQPSPQQAAPAAPPTIQVSQSAASLNQSTNSQNANSQSPCGFQPIAQTPANSLNQNQPPQSPPTLSHYKKA